MMYQDVVRSRRSVRDFMPDVEIPKEELMAIIEEAMFAPNSTNLNSWRFLIVTEKEQKEALYEVSMQQPAVKGAAAVIILLGDLTAYTVANADEISAKAVAQGTMTEEIRQGINENVSWYYDVSEEQKREWLMLDQGLVAMQLMLSAKDRGYDTVAMSGFETEAVRKLFNIEDYLVNGLIIPIGKAQTPGFETVRRDVSEVVTWLD
ncbi:nitroreductase family protein [Enterococcus faecalis]|uniref:nitroreductase family protein n=1 Tax=Enterococcus faecalis TaxID=1351 RepID=UPI0001B2E5DB|nr:nitroreductase family protein [Enterococcus faecalis]EEU78911.1 nitroreductase [Enterococcus faecalis Fly1]EHZ2966175.1 nitroreductase family protein [Enterococcus faecalis]MCD5121848.1 nitroreductase family protein [Enterococcus faecalis]OOP42882.1 NAD(P)H nitroreductase [Enterococcus faecalis]HAP4786683.1 nitroreductase family protein [Enterococcus faecalis]